MVWLGWLAVLAITTAGPIKWHISYFQHAGPLASGAVLLLVPFLAVAPAVYAKLRRGWIWRHEPLAFSISIVVIVGIYEPIALIVVAALFLSCTVLGTFLAAQLEIVPDQLLDAITISFGLGCGALIIELFGLGLAQLFYPVVFLLLLAAPPILFHTQTRQILIVLRSLVRNDGASPDLRHPLAGIAVVFAAIAVLCTLLVALAPSIVFDTIQFHIPIVRHYAAQHSLDLVPAMNYSYRPQGFEVLWTTVFALAGQAGTQLLSPLFFGLFLVVLYRLGRQCGADRGAALTGVVCAATLPFLHWSGSVTKNDLAMAFYQALALYVFTRWLARANFRWIVAGAFFFAMSFGVKNVALFGAVPLALL